MKGKFLVLASLILLALYSVSEAAYRLHLRNGSVIEGISSYEREKGEIRFKLGAGEIGVPENDVIRIEEYKPEKGEVLKEEIPTKPEEKTPPPSPQMKEAPKEPSAGRVVTLQNRLNRVNREIEEIEGKEKELGDLNDELNRVRLRIENLYKKGRENCARKEANPPNEPVDPAQRALTNIRCQQQYLQYLTPEERQTVQMNFMKKRKLEAETKEKEEDPEFEAALTEKRRLLEEKRALEDELTGLQSVITF